MVGKIYGHQYYLLVSTLMFLVIFFSIFQSVNALDCYDDVKASNVIDCLLHTGCIKKFFIQNQTTIHRGCFLTKGHGDHCEYINDHEGVCYCHSNYCNGTWNDKPAAFISFLLGLLSTMFWI